MFNPFSGEKSIRIALKAEKGIKVSMLVGTAHFFPYSFKGPLGRLIRNARTVILEGPLDKQSMERIRKAGYSDEAANLFQLLEEPAVTRLTEAMKPRCRLRGSGFLQLLEPAIRDDLRRLVQGMKPWLAFFTLWSRFLEKEGWIHSVDLEAYCITVEEKKPVVYLESVEEQIAVLEALSEESFIWYIGQADRWQHFARSYIRHYLRGDLERLLSSGMRFPTRAPDSIGQRDHRMVERMLPYLDEGGAAVFVGAPHLKGIGEILRSKGFTVRSSVVD